MSSPNPASLTAAEKRALLQQLLQQQAEFPLSSGQQWMWFLQQLAPGSAAYHFPIALRVRSAIDVDAVRLTLHTLVQRHASLRTVFREFDGHVRQYTRARVDAAFSVLDASALDTRALGEAIRAASEQPFDLGNGPVFRTTLFRESPTDSVLLFVWHHLVLDGWSLSVFLEEFGTLYAAACHGSPPAFASTAAATYEQFVRAQQAMLETPTGRAHADFWRERIGRAEPLELPTDFRRPAQRAHVGGAVLFTLGEDLTARVKSLAIALHTTPFVLLLGCFQAMLHRVSGRRRVPVSFPANGRTQGRYERTIGFFVNQLLAVGEFEGVPTFRSLIDATRQQVLDALEHQDFHLSLIAHGDSASNSRHMPETMFVLQKSQGYALELPDGTLRERGWLEDAGVTTSGDLGGLHVESYPLATPTARFDIEVQMLEAGSALIGWLQYDRELFTEQTARIHVKSFEQLVAAAVDDVDQRIAEVELTDDDTRAQLLHHWNETQRSWPDEGSIAELFASAAGRNPGALAALFEAETITYAQLDARSSQVAHALRNAGVQPQQIVGICIPRSIDMLVALLGILKAGCVYLPLDPSNPQERLAFMLRDSRAEFLVASGDTCTRFRNGAVQQLCLHCDASVIAECSTSAPPLAAGPLLNILYTSGSTGQPKGVRGTQLGAINRIRWMWEAYPFGAGELCAQVTTLGFVDAVWEIFGPLLHGVPSVIIADEDIRELPRFVTLLESHRATRITLVPTLLRALLEQSGVRARLARLRYWSCAGEALEPSLAKLFHKRLSDSRLFNLYGCSEAAADSTCYEVPFNWNGERVPIGRPIANTQIYVLDANGRLAPPQMVGEIHIGGDGLADGYVGRADLTAQRFVSRACCPENTLYRTGDLGRVLVDGTFEYFGRSDHQVKVRGNRVELGEIEVVLREHPAVESAVVVAVHAAHEETTLVAYVVYRVGSGGAPGSGSSVAALRAALATRLPAYMLPSHFVELPAMPLTASGKLNRQALPPFDSAVRGEDFAEPQNRIEYELAMLWADVLGLPRMGTHDNFFEWGGHSMLALQASGRASKQFQRPLPVALIFQYPTVASFAAFLGGSAETRSRHEVVAINSTGSRPTLFWLPGGAGSHGFDRLARLAERLGPDQPLHAVATWRAERWSEIESVPERADAYVTAIRETQPHGPYQLAGFCLGGVVAFEVAQRLRAAGEEVSFLGLINTWLPANAIAGSQWMSLFAQRAVYHVRESLKNETVPRRQYLLRRFQTMRRMFRRRKETALLRQDLSIVGDRAVRDDEVLRATVHLASQYAPEHFPGKLHLFLSDEPELRGVRDATDPRRAWRRVASGHECILLNGGHDALLDEPLIETFAAHLRRALTESQANARD